MKFGKQPAPVADIDEDNLEVHKPKAEAAGVKAVMVALERAVAQAGVARTAHSLLRLNQRGGFDCPGCAWPESDKKRTSEEVANQQQKAAWVETPSRTAGAQKDCGWRIGQSVMHQKFGEGVIVNIEGGGDNARASINFGRNGMKLLDLTIAKLEKVE